MLSLELSIPSKTQYRSRWFYTFNKRKLRGFISEGGGLEIVYIGVIRYQLQIKKDLMGSSIDLSCFISIIQYIATLLTLKLSTSSKHNIEV
ncbi:hypothetical protein RCL_jg26316.t1 [Rhizophagus clarus]|uniref:Uncharacterized protein n=1 Tax=Rhizophagus clarus TaxID=94130 RepID=A0A8H3KYV0_9GLOM|nr:hypothetical protein RCL_jg26316.t1 [Rhizophagus clarus]